MEAPLDVLGGPEAGLDLGGETGDFARFIVGDRGRVCPVAGELFLDSAAAVRVGEDREGLFVNLPFDEDEGVFRDDEGIGGDAPRDDGFAESSPVGSYPRGASPFGIEDLSGNVYEWCLDFFDVYRGTNRINPRGPGNGTKRVKG